jgi:ABC-type Fe3+ transport system permease subunit
MSAVAGVAALGFVAVAAALAWALTRRSRPGRRKD